MDYLSMAACFKDEATYLREWIEFHLLVGVERFYLYDNASTDASREVLRPYEEAGIAKIYATNMECCQFACYYNALHTFGGGTRWMGFIDVDEFLFCPDGRDLKAFLREFERYPGVKVGWCIFGSSGHRTRPEGLVIENYTHCAHRSFAEHRHIKSIVDPRYAFCPAGNSHDFVMLGCRTPPVDENRVPSVGPFRDSTFPWTIDRIRLNHYFTKSLEEWNQKHRKGRADLPRNDPGFIRPYSDFARMDRNEVRDTTILRYVPELKRRLSSIGPLPMVERQ